MAEQDGGGDVEELVTVAHEEVQVAELLGGRGVIGGGCERDDVAESARQDNGCFRGGRQRKTAQRLPWTFCAVEMA